jgi:hypothetical protein
MVDMVPDRSRCRTGKGVNVFNMRHACDNNHTCRTRMKRGSGSAIDKLGKVKPMKQRVVVLVSAFSSH